MSDRGQGHVVYRAWQVAAFRNASRARAAFYDQAQLARHFKRIVGLTPGRYVRDAVI